MARFQLQTQTSSMNPKNPSFALALLSSLLLGLGCSKESPYEPKILSGGDFEAANFFPDPSTEQTGWTSTDLTLQGNTLEISQDTVHSGLGALRAHAGTGNAISKSALISDQWVLLLNEKNIEIQFWLYIPSNQGLENLHILSLEDNREADKRSGIGFGFDANNALYLDRSTMDLPDVFQPAGKETAFPFDQWVYFDIQILLKSNSTGWAKVWQDGALIIEALSTNTLPKTQFHLSDAGDNAYTKVAVGITTNGTGHAVTLFLDDFSVFNWN
jgi:hypothetical protein